MISIFETSIIQIFNQYSIPWDLSKEANSARERRNHLGILND